MNCPESEGSEEDCWDCGEDVCEREGVGFAGFCNGGRVWKLKVEELENVGFGCTGPSSWSRALRPGFGVSSSGSWASVSIAVIDRASADFSSAYYRLTDSCAILGGLRGRKIMEEWKERGTNPEFEILWLVEADIQSVLLPQVAVVHFLCVVKRGVVSAWGICGLWLSLLFAWRISQL